MLLMVGKCYRCGARCSPGSGVVTSRLGFPGLYLWKVFRGKILQSATAAFSEDPGEELRCLASSALLAHEARTPVQLLP